MKQYIVNLTGHLISKNRYDDALGRINNLDEFVRHVKINLEGGDVHDMSPAKLGEIMCSLVVGDVMASKKELFNRTHFTGNGEEFLRELVSLCLAYAIRDRLAKDYRSGTTPQWEGRRYY